jgi:hypothetical protein
MSGVIVAGGCSGVVWMPAAAVDYVARWGAVAHWTLNAASGNETDSINSQALVATNTPGSAAGVVGNARQFNSANSRRFTLADNATMSTGNIDFWVSCWVYLDSKAANQIFVSKGATSTTEFYLQYLTASDRFTFNIRGAAGGTVRTATATTFGSPSLSTWYHLVGYHDATGDLVGIAVSGGTFDTTATAATAPADQAGAFNVGALSDATQFTDGRIDEVSFGKSPALGIAALATEIRARLYNAGSGRAYPWS